MGDSNRAALRDKVRGQATGAGGLCELAREDVLGFELEVFKSRKRSLRELVAEAGAREGVEYLVEGTRRITYREHASLVASVAAALKEKHGVEKGDRVAILAANCVAWPIAFWATVSLGGVVAALNGWWTADEIEYGLSDSDPKLLIGDRKRLARLDGTGVRVPTLEIETDFAKLEQFAPDAPLPDVALAEDDAATILYTSGTTGRPKGAVGSHRGLIGFVDGARATATLNFLVDLAEGGSKPSVGAGRPQTVSLAAAPMFHLSGLYGSIVLQLAFGGKLVIRSGRFDPGEVLALMEGERITQFTSLGSMGHRVAAHPDLLTRDLSSVTHVGFGGAPASPAIQEKMRQAFPGASQNLGIGYGSSETVAIVASFNGKDYVEHPEATGYLAVGQEVEIRDENGAVLPRGEQGRIFVRSAWSMLEYWRNPDATAKTIGPDRFLETGDIGRVEESGLMYINSRARDMILRNAENVYPVEIEYRLDSHPGVRECAVYGIEHDEWGQEVKAVVVPQEGRALSTDALATWCGETLASFKVPTAWEIRPAPLPRNPAGKVLKNVLQGAAANVLTDE